MSDLISRQAAIDALKDEVILIDGYCSVDNRVIDESDAIEAINSIPSARPNQKVGKWIYKSCIGWEETWICSECGEETTSTCMRKPRYKWCPMCGAKMEEQDG